MASRRLLPLLPVLAVAAGVLVPAGALGAGTVRLSADAKGKLKFNTTHLRTSHGKVTLVMKNPSGSGIPHAIAVQGKGLNKKGKIVSPGGTSRLTVTLKKGTYTFYCPVDGHKAAGMKGTLVVS
jgi:uncharacterized cupredoxin-like copper-binding protein